MCVFVNNVNVLPISSPLPMTGSEVGFGSGHQLLRRCLLICHSVSRHTVRRALLRRNLKKIQIATDEKNRPREQQHLQLESATSPSAPPPPPSSSIKQTTSTFLYYTTTMYILDSSVSSISCIYYDQHKQ